MDIQPQYLVSGPNANFRTLQQTFPLLQCPSDENRRFDYDVNVIAGVSLGVPPLSTGRANFAANWGNTNWEQSADLNGDGLNDVGVQFFAGPFGRQSVSLQQVVDGLDQTVFVAEVVKGDGFDIRGAHFAPIPGGSHYMSRLGPNGNRDFFGFTGPGTGRSGDQIPFPAMCHSTLDLPCDFDPARTTSFSASRSRHTGGVHTLLGSGSLRFANNVVDSKIWIAIHSINGNEHAQLD